MTVLTRVLCTSHNTATEGSTRASSYQSCGALAFTVLPKRFTHLDCNDGRREGALGAAEVSRRLDSHQL